MRLVSRQKQNYSGKPLPRVAKATAVVELAVVLPLVLTLLFGIVEFGWVFMVSQTLTTSAREACRVAILEGTTDQEILAKIDQYMSNTGVGGYAVDISHATPGDPTEVVTLTVPYADISLLGGYFNLGDFTLRGYAAMRKEGI